MIDPLKLSLKIASSGLDAQSTRMRVVAENLANAESTGKTPGADPYSRKTVTFADELDDVSGAKLVKIDRISTDTAPFRLEHDPSHPAADASGMVKLPNVNVLVEMADMREANRSYTANVQVIRQARDMISMTIDLLRNSS
jgi:flagellar basal-body rod protein FlgC